jgi:hypothetical protein
MVPPRMTMSCMGCRSLMADVNRALAMEFGR